MRHSIKYEDAKNIIQEGDVLLFRGQGVFSWFIQKVGQGEYSHVGLASWVYDKAQKKHSLECVEFREFRGGRAISLEQYVRANPGIIDVYRAASPQYKSYYYNFGQNKIVSKQFDFDGRAITNCMRRQTGLPYGWARIWWLAKFYLPILRLFSSGAFDDNEKVVYPVCSTAIAACFSKHFVDLTHHRSDNWMEPSDVARSPILHYLFTLTN